MSTHASRHPTRDEIATTLRVIEALYIGTDDNGSLAFCDDASFEPDCACCVAGRLHKALTDYVNSEDMIEL